MHFNTFTCDTGGRASAVATVSHRNTASADYLFISDIIGVSGGWFLHGNQAEHLKHVVLHHITSQDKGNEADLFKG